MNHQFMNLQDPANLEASECIESPEKLINELNALPKGTIVYKNIGGKKRPYLQWKESGKTKNKYIKSDNLEMIQAQVERRRFIESELKENNFNRYSYSGSMYQSYTLQEENAPAYQCYMQSLPGHTFNTNVIWGEPLDGFISDVKNYKKRDCFSIVQNYISGPKKDMVCALYGLRRSGKTVMLKQAIAGIDGYCSSAAYIKLRVSDNLEKLNEDIKYLQSHGIHYLFLDEITLMENFIDGASLFSDVFAATGMKIVISGTDSLGFWLTSSNELYDRVILVHTSYVSYKEHRRLLGIEDIDEFIRYGGTLRAGELNFDNSLDVREASFRDDESARVYVDTAIAYNIQNSLKYFKGGYFRNLQNLYDAGELTNAINRVVEHDNHEFTAHIITKLFKSSDLGSASQLAMSSADEARRTNILSMVDRERVTQSLMRILDIRNDLSVKVEEHQVNAIKEYLKALDLFEEINLCYLGDAPMAVRNVLVLPGLRFCQAQALIASLDKDEAFGRTDRKTRSLIKEIIEEDVSGKILEEIVLLETKKSIEERCLNLEIGKLLFPDGEIDMYLYNPKTFSCDLFEIKHSSQVDSKQQRHLLDEKKIKAAEEYFGGVSSRSVIYRGPGRQLANGINYINAEEYLMGL